jgi:hypothetical protein
MRFHAAAFALVAIAACTLVYAQPAPAEELVDSTTAIPVYSLGFMTEMYAQDMKLYQKHGVNMKMLQINGLGTINAVIAGSVEFRPAFRRVADPRGIARPALAGDHRTHQSHHRASRVTQGAC